MKSLRILFILVFASTYSLYAQDPSLQWQQVYFNEYPLYSTLKKISQTPDSGYTMCGHLLDANPYTGGSKMRVTKLDPEGDIAWTQLYGQDFVVFDFKSTTDQGYIAAGVGSCRNCFPSYQVFKLSENGFQEWKKTIGGSGNDFLHSIDETNDGGYILGGTSDSNISGDKTENSRGSIDYWIVKINNLGSIVWQKTIGGSSHDDLNTVIETADNGYILAGTSKSGISGEKTDGNKGGYDYWIVKLEPTGNIEWQKTIGVSLDDILATIKITTDGGYILTGTSSSNISGDKTENSSGLNDYWVVKLNSVGDIEWQNTIGGSEYDISKDIIQTSDGGYIVGGSSNSGISGNKNEQSQGGQDYWIVKLNNDGSIAWQNNIGGNAKDVLESVRENSDGSLILGGTSESGISGDKTVGGQNSYGTYWVIKHSAVLDVQDFDNQKGIRIYPNPVQSILNIESSKNFIETVKIYNINGGLISEFKNLENPASIDLSRLESDIYFVEISNTLDVTIKKIIKE